MPGAVRSCVCGARREGKRCALPLIRPVAGVWDGAGCVEGIHWLRRLCLSMLPTV